MKALTLRLPDDIHEALRQRAFDERTSITALILDALTAPGLAERCWCGGEMGPRTPGDANGLGCLADIQHSAPARTVTSVDSLIEAGAEFDRAIAALDARGSREAVSRERIAYARKADEETWCLAIGTLDIADYDTEAEVQYWADKINAILALDARVLPSREQVLALIRKHYWDDLTPSQADPKKQALADAILALFKGDCNE